MAEPIEELASRVFATRNMAHREHLKVKGAGSFAKHMALGEFYDGIVGAIDTIVEVHQGRFGLISIPVTADKAVSDIASHILNEALWIEKNRDSFSKSQAVLNRVDDLTAIYLQAVYKLTYLA